MPTSTTIARTIASECLSPRIRRLDRKVTRIYDQARRPHKITAAQLNLLVMITVSGPIAAGKLAKAMDLERLTTKTRQAVTGNSQTARILAEQQDAAGQVMGSMVRGGTRGAVEDLISRAIMRAQGVNEDVAAIMGEYLFSTDPTAAAQFARRFPGGVPSIPPPLDYERNLLLNSLLRSAPLTMERPR